MTMDPLYWTDHAASRFALRGVVTAVESYGSGNVHDTFLVTVSDPDRPRFILQKVNTRVFRDPVRVMENMRTVSGHIRQRLQSPPIDPSHRWQPVLVLQTAEGADHWVDPSGFFWRALSFIKGAHTRDAIRDPRLAREIGCALGLFHALISDLDCGRLFDTLEGFHITPRYLDHFDAVLSDARLPMSPELDHALRWVSDRRRWATVLEDAKATGELPLRPIHGDPKVANVMIDDETGQAVSLVDLDTVKPGLIQYDIGDCLRSGCNPAGELPERLEAVRFDTDLCKAILEGYCQFAARFLLRRDYEYFYDAVRLISFELGLRFLTDYLEGNVYFKVQFPEHNLQRALVQFKLNESIESQEAAIRAIIRDLA